MTPFLSRSVRIEWHQCDPAEIVYAPRLLDNLRRASSCSSGRPGLPKKHYMLPAIAVVGYPMVDPSARFLATCTDGGMIFEVARRRGEQSRLQLASGCPLSCPI